VLVLAGAVLEGAGAELEATGAAEEEGDTVTVKVLVLVECTVLVRVLVDSGMGEGVDEELAGATGTRVGSP